MVRSSLLVVTLLGILIGSLEASRLVGASRSGGVLPLNVPLISASDATSDVSYTSAGDLYLVVFDQWNTPSPVQGDVFLKTVGPTGAESAVLAVDVSAADSRAPRVAWGNEDQFLVVWQHKVSGGAIYTIRGQFVTVSGGAAALSGPAFDVATGGSYSLIAPDVGFSTTTGEYFVAYALTFSSSMQNIIVRTVTASGVLGTAVNVSGGTGPFHSQPSVSPRRDSDVMAVAFRRQVGSEGNIYVNGFNLGTNAVLSALTLVTSDTRDEVYPSLGGMPGVPHDYLTWSVNSGTSTAANWDISGRRVTATSSGISLGNLFSVESATTRTSYRSCTARTANRLIVGYQESTTIPAIDTWDIRYRSFDPSVDPPSLVESQNAFLGGGNQGAPALALKAASSTGVLVFQDPAGGYNSATVSVSLVGVTHVVSRAGIASGPSVGVTGTSYTFTSTVATCSQGHAMTYSFDWGDGSASPFSSSLSASHVWSMEGEYSISPVARCSGGGKSSFLLVVDGGFVVTAPEHLLSDPAAPSGAASATASVSETYASGGSLCSSGHAVTYRFDWGDGIGTYGAASQSHAWAGSGTYSVRAQARCASGELSAWSGTRSVSVTPAHALSSPAAPSGSSTGTAGNSMTYQSVDSTDSLSHGITYQFDWGDGSLSPYSPSVTADHVWTQAGIYRVKVRASCSSGLETAWSPELLVTLAAPPSDVDPPTVEITEPTTDAYVSTTTTPFVLEGSASDNLAVSRVSWVNLATAGSGVAGGTTLWTTSIPLTLGYNQITVTARDAAGNVETDVITVSYSTISTDTTPPVISIDSPTSESSYSTPWDVVSLGGVATDDQGVTTVTWSNAATTESGSAAGTASWTAPIPLARGENVITLRAFDSAGNSATDEVTVTYVPLTGELEPPVVTISDPTTDALFSTQSTPLVVGGSATDNVGVSSVTWSNASTSGTGAATGTGSWSASIPLTAGENLITITARDAAGNAGTDSIAVTYSVAGADTVSPTVSIGSPTSGSSHTASGDTVALSGVAADNVGVVSVTWSNSATSGSGSAVGTDAWSASIPLAEGSNGITVRAVDAAGNASTDSLTVTYLPPVSSPVAEQRRAKEKKGICGSVGLDLMLLPAFAWWVRRRRRGRSGS